MRFAQAVAAVGTVVVPGAQPRAIVQKGTLCLIRLIVLGALRRTAFNGKDGVESLGRKERHIAHIARGLRVLGITIFDRLAPGFPEGFRDGRFDSLQECPPEKCLQWKTRHGKSGTKAYCVYCAGDGSSLPEGFRRL